MATFSDQPNPAPFQLPAPTGPGGGPPGPGGAMGSSKQLKIRGIANAAKQRGAKQMMQLKQMMTGTQHAPAGVPPQPQPSGLTATAAARTLVEKRGVIDRFIHTVIFG